MSAGRMFNSWRGPGKGFLCGMAMSILVMTANMNSRWFPFRQDNLSMEVTAHSAQNAAGETREADQDSVARHLQSQSPVGG